MEYHTIDKTDWPEGPWKSEPDKVQWKDQDTNLPCLAVRHTFSGHWCGYVGVTAEHPCYEDHYDGPDLQVHGGLTFSDKCQKGNEAEVVCHIPEPGESDDVWWLGFDCAHLGDLSPARDSLLPEGMKWPEWPGETYRDLEFVKDQCRKLASQLSDLSKS